MSDEPLKSEEIDWKIRAEEYLAGWKRAMADYQNREKELAREKQEFARFAATALFTEFLPVLDNLCEAVAHIPDAQKELGWVKGVVLIQKQFEDALTRHEVRAFGAAGDVFDTSRHEAVGEEPGEPGDFGPGEPNKVVRVIAPGYELAGRVIRPAKVIVGKQDSESKLIPSE
ncbi:nucleotide exchange factor GrpE [Patescibacteria group bacterium]|nr:MAG: nucleotide exchange factor GrpE [Patescibacteria group bacterium]